MYKSGLTVNSYQQSKINYETILSTSTLYAPVNCTCEDMICKAS